MWICRSSRVFLPSTANKSFDQPTKTCIAINWSSLIILYYFSCHAWSHRDLLPLEVCIDLSLIHVSRQTIKQAVWDTSASSVSLSKHWRKIVPKDEASITSGPTHCDHNTVKPVIFACPLFRDFCEPSKFAKITGLENLNTVAFQCNRKQKRQNYGVQNNYIDSNTKIKGSTVIQPWSFVQDLHRDEIRRWWWWCRMK